jgi:hypothetical protein
MLTASCQRRADTAIVLSHNRNDTDSKPGLEYRQPNLGGGDARPRSLPRDGIPVPSRRRASSRGQLEAARRSRAMAPQGARPHRVPLRGMQRASSGCFRYASPGRVSSLDATEDDCLPVPLICPIRYHVPQTSTALSFLFICWAHNVRQETKERNAMSDVANCRAMELLCRERATADPSQRGKWLGQAQRWQELRQRETAWQFQRRNGQQQMHAGPMAMGPNPVERELRNKQQG